MPAWRAALHSHTLVRVKRSTGNLALVVFAIPPCVVTRAGMASYESCDCNQSPRRLFGFVCHNGAWQGGKAPETPGPSWTTQDRFFKQQEAPALEDAGETGGDGEAVVMLL
jgi:hypothetical protein